MTRRERRPRGGRLARRRGARHERLEPGRERACGASERPRLPWTVADVPVRVVDVATVDDRQLSVCDVGDTLRDLRSCAGGGPQTAAGPSDAAARTCGDVGTVEGCVGGRAVTQRTCGDVGTAAGRVGAGARPPRSGSASLVRPQVAAGPFLDEDVAPSSGPPGCSERGDVTLLWTVDVLGVGVSDDADGWWNGGA